MARTRAAVFDHHKRALLDVVALAILPQAGFDGFLGRLLQAHVDRGAHDQRMLGEGFCDALDLVEGPVEEEVRRLGLASRSMTVAGLRRAAITWPSVISPPWTRLVSTSLARARAAGRLTCGAYFGPAP